MSNETGFQARFLNFLQERGWQVTDLGKNRFSLVLDAPGIFLSFHLNADLLKKHGEFTLNYEFLELAKLPTEEAEIEVIAPQEQEVTRSLTLLCPKELTKNEILNDNRDRILIGRGLKCDLVLMDPLASREHAVITREGQDYWIQNLKTANGLFLNEIAIDRNKLKTGDWIRIGDLRIQVQIEVSTS